MESPHALLELILDAVPQPVWVVDHAGHIVFANPAAVAVLGYDDLAELKGKPSHETVHHHRPDGSVYPAAECPLLRPRMTGETVRCDDDWFFRRDGSMFPISWRSAPLALPDGRGAVVAFVDTTERRAAEQVVRERDAAEIRAAESRATGRRIMESATAARRQLARDLHDGAQQQLVSVLLELRLVREELGTDPARALRLLEEATEHTQTAIDELRELASGIHPAILASRGLVSALKALAARCPLPVLVTGAVEVELADEVEACAYFLVAEALTNAVKHSHASRVMVTVTAREPLLTVEVHDDGIGGAAPSGSGSGLAGLADRVDALDGQLTLDSPVGGPTVVVAEFPL
ncbi:PAS domain-containing sensor histidine kinase [Amycolatopsis sp. FDAARGOS 1241]|uniref:sensor histidine kinase n=1 Tax=Amycolatopsis sp. FDAARGOS 1241 TaxID=2778070 RepID=UPI001950C429|nr:PAS domain-containing sensor histidine kinase [Amycolatopsis sp. FDAARGOS 1241]QRP43310.1 PAS domain S-box protein [Amycolatopsis sp. FDAARGOS 1241]